MTVEERKSDQFSVTCPKPGCKYTLAGLKGNIEFSSKRQKRYLNVRHYERVHGEPLVTNHVIGKIDTDGVSFYYASPNNEDLTDKVNLRAQVRNEGELVVPPTAQSLTRNPSFANYQLGRLVA